MNTPFIVDAHTHLGEPGNFFLPEVNTPDLLRRMDELAVAYAVCSHLRSIVGVTGGPEEMRRAHEESGGRIVYLDVFDPRRGRESLRAIEREADRPGFAGVKIHPSFHRTPAEDPSYEPVWKFAAERGLPVLAHTWSVSSYNPVQHLSTPGRFERWIQKFPTVTLVLGHAGGRGGGRAEAVRLAREYPGVHLDFAGDIFCFRLIENLAAEITADKILFGTDFPWFDPSAHLSRVLLAGVPDADKMKILSTNARRVYKLH